ncbi:MAG: methylenetetrahydrofolate reductase [Thaumarchaeota archaeon]|nr:methylenetetrahydrofolate reductase [Nitrososphaerota archaeon]
MRENFDVFHVADLKNPRLRFADSLMTASHLKRTLRWLEVAPTLTARDRNRKSLEEAIASTIFFGIENLILIWGDPFQIDGPSSRNVYDVRGVSGLVKVAREVQARLGARNLCIMTPVDLAKAEDKQYVQMIRRREEAGSDVFLSQPFPGEIVEYMAWLEKLRDEGVRSPILHNVFPFRSRDDALEVSRRFGLKLPKHALDRLRDGGAQAGVKMARESLNLLRANKTKADGVFVSSRGDLELASKVVE